MKAFTDADITLEPILWSEDVDNARACADWGRTPDYDVDRFFEE